MNAAKMKLVLSSKCYKMGSLVTYQLVSLKKIISPILASNFNYLLEVGKFPDELKHQFTRMIVMNFLKTIGLYQLYQFLEKSLRKLFTPDCTTILYLREFYMINNLDLKSTTQQAMH